MLIWTRKQRITLCLAILKLSLIHLLDSNMRSGRFEWEVLSKQVMALGHVPIERNTTTSKLILPASYGWKHRWLFAQCQLASVVSV